MLSPLVTVLVLAVLWLIVVIPMVMRRSDERKQDRSIDGFGRAMRALGRRGGALGAGRSSDPADADEYDDFAGADSDDPLVYVPIRTRTTLAAPERRPVPAAQEALMYPEAAELSDARRQMLARRRRSLGTLIGGSALFFLLAVTLGGFLWVLFTLFLAGLAGYTWFLRSQALRDRSRRETRQARASVRRPVGYDATDDLAEVDRVADTVVRIDDDDIELQSMDTMDLTGLYEEEMPASLAQRRAS